MDPRLRHTNLTHIAAHAKRGRQAFDDIGILAVFKGVLTHDGWGAYKSLDCKHSLCNAHHARELAFVHKDLMQAYDDLLTIGREENPLESANGKRGRTKQSKASNLIGRLFEHADEVWLFARDPSVPFTNNEAERVMRMIR